LTNNNRAASDNQYGANASIAWHRVVVG
jgi:hypothetical protein